MIMYTLLAGQHPLHKPGESAHDYRQKLRAPEWHFPPHFSDLAKDLFLKLARPNPLERCAAKQALSHPWITRVPGRLISEGEALEECAMKVVEVSLWTL